MTELETFRLIRQQMNKRSGCIQVSGCIDSQKAHLMACLAQAYPVTMIVAPNDLRAREIYENYRVFDRDVMLYPARDFIFFQADVSSRTLTTQRVRVMQALSEIVNGERTQPVTVVLTLTGLMSHCMRPQDWRDQVRAFSVGDEIDLDEEKKALTAIGYERTDQVEEPGQFAVRGGILDIWPLTEEVPVRIELWGDEIDNLRTFDAQSQRTREQIASLRVYPASEFVTTEAVTEAGLARIRKEAQAQGDFTVETLAARLCEEYDITPEEARQDVGDILAEWTREGVIE